MRTTRHSAKTLPAALAAVLALAGTAVAAHASTPEPGQNQETARTTEATAPASEERTGTPTVTEIELADDHRVTVGPADGAPAFLGEPGDQLWELALDQHPAPDSRESGETTEPAAPEEADEPDVPDTSGERDEPAERPEFTRLTALEGPAPVAVYAHPAPDEAADADGTEVAAAEPRLILGFDEEFPADGPVPLDSDPELIRWAFAEPGDYRLALADEDGGTAEFTVFVAAAAPALPPGTGSSSTGAGPGLSRSAPPGGLLESGTRSLTTALPAAPRNVVTDRVVLDQGHLDLAARVIDGALHFHVKDGTTPGEEVWRAPGSVVLHVRPEAERKIPANDAYAFLGTAGDPVWLLDQVQQDGLLWPGWSTETIAPGTINGPVEFRLDEVDGPGDFALFLYDSFAGSSVLFNSADGVPDAFDIPQDTHAHGGWAFTAEGVYQLKLTMSATLAAGGTVSDTQTLTFAIGEIDPATVTPPGENSSGGGNSSGGDGDGDGDGPNGGTTSGGTTSGGSGGGGTDGGTKNSGSMAQTGADGLPVLVAGAVGLTLAGAVALLLMRRLRRRTQSVVSDG